MQKLHLSIVSLVVLLLFNLSVHAQTTTPASYYKGKWDILIKGTPNGDVHLIFNLQNVDETIKGSFVDPVSKADVDLTKTEYADGKPTLYFTVAGYDVNLVLEKKDDDHVSGSLMGMFEASGERVKDLTPASYYKGKWDMFIKGTPNGDVHLFFNLVDSAETVNGTFVDPDTNADVALTKTEFADGKPTLYFTVKGYDVSLSIEKKDDDHVAGSLMGMFEVTGERVKKQQ